jgi:RNA polymerase sigma-B factor
MRWRERGDQRARTQMVERYLPLARKLARRYRNSWEPTEDLQQVASVGLLGAVDRFDPGRGQSFSSFAVPTILGELKRYFRDTGWSVHVPRDAKERGLRVERAAVTIETETGRAARVQEIAQYLEITVEDVLSGLDAGRAHFSASLDEPPTSSEDEDQDASRLDRLGICDPGYGVVETKLSLAAAFARLPYLERLALSLRVEHDLKQVEIAERMGCSQMQVSRLLHRAARRVQDFIDPEDPCAVLSDPRASS